MAITEPLTEREQQALEHRHKAQELGATLKEYASRFGLDVQELYQLRKPLVRKGALGPARRPDPERRRPGWQRCWLGDPMLRPNKAWVDELLPGTPPNSALGKALGYAHRQWKMLVLLLRQGRRSGQCQSVIAGADVPRERRRPLRVL